MAIIVPNRYPLDYTGLADSNLIASEQVTLVPGAFRVFSPLYSPFFKKNIRIVDAANGLQLDESQYSCKCLVASASAIAGTGNEVYSIVVIIDSEVSNNLSVSYQTVGGPYTSGYESIVGMVSNLLSTNQVGNNDPVDWSIVENLPEGFPENLHLHSLGSTAGWEFLATSLEKLRMSILLGDQLSKSFVLSYIDQAITEAINMRTQIAAPGSPLGDHISNTDNPHNVSKAQIELGNVLNYPIATMIEAFDGTRGDRYLTADQVKAVVQDRVDMGLDAHILNTDNPHAVNKAQVGLNLVENYGVADADDLATPVDGTTKYVTNHSAHAFLTQYFAELNSDNNTLLEETTAAATSALGVAQSALTTANASLLAAQAATATITAASQAADQAVLAANANLTNVQNSESAALALVNQYVASAVVEAETAAYARGFDAGVASMQP
jgi:hypothetical protein